MAELDELYGGFMTSADVPVIGTSLQITGVTVDKRMGKVILQFNGIPLKLPLNKTNAGIIASKLGKELGSWVGKYISIRQGTVLFNGRYVASVQVTDASSHNPETAA